jgi:hypothetical protein
VKSRICLREGSRKTETEELAIVQKLCRGSSEYGDSGALVLLPIGDVIGLLWGLRIDKETSLMGGEASYFTNIGSVVEHIQEITGYQVRIGETWDGLSAEERTNNSRVERFTDFVYRIELLRFQYM